MFEIIESIEQAILQFLIRLHTPILDKIMIFITNLGNHGEIWIALGLILLIFRKHRKAGVTVLISLVIMLLFNDYFLKVIVGRSRPYIALDIELLIPLPDPYSFPSGHTASSFAVAFALYKFYKKYALIYFSGASLMAFTRLYLTMHYPTDVIGGIIVGYLCAFAAIYIVNKLYPLFRPNERLLK